MRFEINHAKRYSWSVAMTRHTKKNLQEFPWLKPWAEGRFSSCTVENCLLVEITVQKGDRGITDSAFIKEIAGSAKMLGLDKVVLMPYAHKTNYNVAGYLEAKEVMLNMARAIRRNTSLEIYLPPPIVDKSFSVEVPGHHYNVAFRSIEPEQSAEQLSKLLGTSFWDFYQEHLSQIKNREKTLIGDLGCGHLGRHTIFLGENGFQVLAVDKSLPALSMLRKKLGKNTRVTAINADIRNLPIASSSLDAVLSVEVLSHGKKTEIARYLEEMRRVLKLGGRLLLVVASTDFLRFARKDDAVEIEPGTFVNLNLSDGNIPHHFFTVQEVCQMLNGYNILSIRKVLEETPWVVGKEVELIGGKVEHLVVYAEKAQEQSHSKGARSILSFLKKEKEWAKLNVSYLAGSITATTAAFVSSQIAEKLGMSRTSATTVIAGVSAYLCGISAICASWWLFHKEKYSENPKRLFTDMLKLVGNTFLAQAITWGASWSGTAIAVGLGASNFLAVTVGQVLDRVVFIPFFNYYNRKRVADMSEKRQP